MSFTCFGACELWQAIFYALESNEYLDGVLKSYRTFTPFHRVHRCSLFVLQQVAIVIWLRPSEVESRPNLITAFWRDPTPHQTGYWTAWHLFGLSWNAFYFALLFSILRHVAVMVLYLMPQGSHGFFRASTLPCSEDERPLCLLHSPTTYRNYTAIDGVSNNYGRSSYHIKYPQWGQDDVSRLLHVVTFEHHFHYIVSLDRHWRSVAQSTTISAIYQICAPGTSCTSLKPLLFIASQSIKSMTHYSPGLWAEHFANNILSSRTLLFDTAVCSPRPLFLHIDSAVRSPPPLFISSDASL